MDVLDFLRNELDFHSEILIRIKGVHGHVMAVERKKEKAKVELLRELINRIELMNEKERTDGTEQRKAQGEPGAHQEEAR
jgi:hypothetical protein